EDMAQFSADGKRLLTAEDGRVNEGTYRSSDGATLAGAWGNTNRDRAVRIWDVETGKEIATLKGHGPTLVSAAFSPDGRRVVTSVDFGSIRLWETTTGKELLRLKNDEKLPWYTLFSPDGQRLLGFRFGRARV